MSDYQEEFWADRGLSRRELRITQQAESAIAILTPLLERDEALSILAADARASPWSRRVTVAISGQRFFVVFWDRRGGCRRTLIADRGSLCARVVDGEEGETVRIRGSSGTLELGGSAVSKKARAIAALLNETSAQDALDE